MDSILRLHSRALSRELSSISDNSLTLTLPQYNCKDIVEEYDSLI